MDAEGFVEIAELATFQRLAHLTTDTTFIGECLGSSDMLEVSQDASRVRRRPGHNVAEGQGLGQKQAEGGSSRVVAVQKPGRGTDEKKLEACSLSKVEDQKAEEPKIQASRGLQPEATGQQENTVFIGGLPWECDEDRLRQDFGECGIIDDVKVMRHLDTGKCRGFAFVTFCDDQGVNSALKYDGDEYAGRTLTVKRAKGQGRGESKGKGEKGKGKQGKGPGPKPEGCTSVVVKGLSYEATEDDLKQTFASCGRGPTQVKILRTKDTRESKGIAFVDFEDGMAVDEAMKLTETELRGRAFFMDYATPRW